MIGAGAGLSTSAGFIYNGERFHKYFSDFAERFGIQDMYELVKDEDYFVITTNVDHCFQKAGFDKKRLFYTQGDYGLFQSTDSVNRSTVDNEAWVMQANEAVCPKQIEDRSIVIDGDSGTVIKHLL